MILGYADIVAAAGDHESECDRIKNAANQLVHYTEQARRIDKITEENGGIQESDLATVIPEVLDDHPLITAEITVTAELPPEAPVKASRMLDSAIGELISNAIEHNDSVTPQVRIEVSVGDGPTNMTELRISDNGPGIPEKELTPLRYGSEEQLVHLSGLGLWLVTWTVDDSQGELFFTETDDGGTLIRMWLPKAISLPKELTDFTG